MSEELNYVNDEYHHPCFFPRSEDLEEFTEEQSLMGRLVHQLQGH